MTRDSLRPIVSRTSLRFSRFSIVALFAVQASAWTSAAALAQPVVAPLPAAAPDEAPVAKAQPKSVLVMDLKYGQGIRKDNAFVMTQEVATELARDSAVRVQTIEDTRVTLGVEAQKQMMGCDENSCLAEIAQAMGTDMLLFGRLDRVGDKVTLQLTLLDSSTAQPKVRVSAKDKDVASILVRMDQVLLNAKRVLNPEFVVDEPPPSPLFLAGLAGVGVGAAVVVACAFVGTAAYILMTDSKNRLAPARDQTRTFFFWPAVVVGPIAAGVAIAGGAVAFMGMSE